MQCEGVVHCVEEYTGNCGLVCIEYKSSWSITTNTHRHMQTVMALLLFTLFTVTDTVTYRKTTAFTLNTKLCCLQSRNMQS